MAMVWASPQTGNNSSARRRIQNLQESRFYRFSGCADRGAISVLRTPARRRPALALALPDDDTWILLMTSRAPADFAMRVADAFRCTTSVLPVSVAVWPCTWTWKWSSAD